LNGCFAYNNSVTITTLFNNNLIEQDRVIKPVNAIDNVKPLSVIHSVNEDTIGFGCEASDMSLGIVYEGDTVIFNACPAVGLANDMYLARHILTK